MPKAFDNCVENGGRVRTVRGPNAKYKLRKGQFRRICILNGKVSMGYVKKRKGGK